MADTNDILRSSSASPNKTRRVLFYYFSAIQKIINIKKIWYDVWKSVSTPYASQEYDISMIDHPTSFPDIVYNRRLTEAREQSSESHAERLLQTIENDCLCFFCFIIHSHHSSFCFSAGKLILFAL